MDDDKDSTPEDLRDSPSPVMQFMGWRHWLQRTLEAAGATVIGAGMMVDGSSADEDATVD